MATDSHGLKVPETFSGFLNKETPNKLAACLCRFQSRFVALQAGNVYYSPGEFDVKPSQAFQGKRVGAGQRKSVSSDGASSSEEDRPDCKGAIDLIENDCEVLAEDATKFVLKPKQGEWASGDFTGADSGRIFMFDVEGYEKSLKQWVDAFNQHLNYAEQIRDVRNGGGASKDGAAVKIQAVQRGKVDRKKVEQKRQEVTAKQDKGANGPTPPADLAKAGNQQQIEEVRLRAQESLLKKVDAAGKEREIEDVRLRAQEALIKKAEIHSKSQEEELRLRAQSTLLKKAESAEQAKQEDLRLRAQATLVQKAEAHAASANKPDDGEALRLRAQKDLLNKVEKSTGRQEAPKAPTSKTEERKDDRDAAKSLVRLTHQSISQKLPPGETALTAKK